ncbi:COG1051 ADP-ribose pyrophosphatase [Candidatus Planktophila versatilis]|jgi:ADP-ribose pyrophosphatase YjhB (NUDIX family)|uniref:NUDIX hydrolase n=1 Tax=Candidatus Planktophila versatilis TaxID=1884905 RepID=A0AAC9YYU1_9ACTN|nr:NUDIX hydrolase [Candidatus Planktophila versatilis]ASY17880.1 NUDIX hydrolase [Candidatus Planktophila versatilis]ASY19201.1 NUDIX hydrolase [Candidatus Planktophila versatilis]ASY23210.1 NUDIX hydrolase [Candidatus Planktophila versatilis]ASY26977.1 NUDIX hydrolase [Candidatus Planktophila versatilis]
MTPAPGAGSEGTKKKRRRKRPAHRSPQSQDVTTPTAPNAERAKKAPAKVVYAKRVDEVSAGGLVVDASGKLGLLIGRRDLKDTTGKRILWSLPKGHIEEGETPEEAALREVQEETGIVSVIEKSLGVIDFWFMAGGKRIHKTVHHYLFRENGGVLAAQESEVDEVAWFPLAEIVERLAYPDEKKLIARTNAAQEMSAL